MKKTNTREASQESRYRLPEGYVLRPVTMDDLEAVLALGNAWARQAMGSNEGSLSELKNFWQMPGVNLAEDMRAVFTPLGKMVGYIEALTMQQPPVNPYIWVRVHPDYEGLGIGEALFAWAERRVSWVLDELDPDLRVAVAGHNVSSYPAAGRLFQSFGYQVTRHSLQMRIEMEGEPEAPTWPVEIRLRAFEPQQHVVDVYKAVDDSFKDHFGYIEEVFETGFARFKHFMMEDGEAFDPALWFVAMDGDEVAGMCLCLRHASEDDELGWVDTLGVRRPWRKRGLGLALLRHSFGEYYRRGFRKVGLGVDASSLTSAVRLYEKAGMRVHRQYDRYEKVLREGVELATVELED